MSIIFRALLLAGVVYYVWKLFTEGFSGANNSSKNSGNQSSTNTKVKFASSEKSHIPDSEGDYIDYQEIK